jgi:hypothetical protein
LRGTKPRSEQAIVLAQLVEEEMAALFERPGTPAAASFEELRERLPQASDASTHLDLAIAYREMGLPADAVEEAGVALRNQTSLTPRECSTALSLIFAPDLFPTPLDAALEGLRTLIFAN